MHVLRLELFLVLRLEVGNSRDSGSSSSSSSSRNFGNSRDSGSSSSSRNFGNSRDSGSSSSSLVGCTCTVLILRVLAILVLLLLHYRVVVVRFILACVVSDPVRQHCSDVAFACICNTFGSAIFLDSVRWVRTVVQIHA